MRVKLSRKTGGTCISNDVRGWMFLPTPKRLMRFLCYHASVGGSASAPSLLMICLYSTHEITAKRNVSCQTSRTYKR